MEKCIHKVQYYETDKMGITHHSNYIRWMEEARIDFLDQIGCSFAQMEADGLLSPVIGVHCNYKVATTFGDAVSVSVRLEEYTGVRYVVAYEMHNTETGQLVALGKTEHCFTNAEGRPIPAHRHFPKYHELFVNLMKLK